MSKPSTVSIDALRTSLIRVLGEVQRRHGDEIDLEVDAYWALPARHAYDLNVPPPAEAHTVASLVDDLGAVRELANGPDEDLDDGSGVIVWHDLAHLVGVLQRLAAVDLP